MVTDTIDKFKEPGEHFTFMGIDLIVTGTQQKAEISGDALPAYLVALYVDKKGKIRHHTFYDNHLPALIAENSDHIPVFVRDYAGEGLADLDRDISEAFDPNYNTAIRNIPDTVNWEEEGNFTVRIVWNKPSY